MGNVSPHRTKKRFGQHFLVDQAIIDQIVALIAPGQGQKIVEIGPGEGVLTEHLIASGAAIIAVEIDRDLIAKLNQRYQDRANFKLINADILKTDIPTFISNGPVHVVGNLPYNISTPLLLHLFTALEHISEMTFMLQTEVVERMCALPGSHDFGRLSILTQTHCRAEKVLAVPPSAFAPQPKVDSAVVKLMPLPSRLPPQVATQLAMVTQAAFSQRRKKIKSGLKKLCSVTELTDIGIDPDARPDMLSVETYVAVARHLLGR